MPNINTIDAVYGAQSPAQGVKACPAITLVSTTEQLFKDQTGAVATVTLQPQAAPSVLGPFDTFCWKLRATWKVTTVTTTTIIATMYLGNPTAIVSGNALATITSQSLVSVSSNGYLEFQGIWDSTSLVISGIQRGAAGTTAVSDTIVTNTGLTAANLAALKFSLSFKGGSSATGAVVTLGTFEVEDV